MCDRTSVIDSPNQQDPDSKNWLRILNFIRDNQPAEPQFVLSLVDDAGVNFGGDIVDLADKRSVLTKDRSKEVETQLLPIIEQSESTSSH